MGYESKSGAVSAVGGVTAVFAGLGALLSVLLMVLSGVFGVALMGSGEDGGAAAGFLLGGGLIVFFGFLFLWCLLEGLAGLAVLKRKQWGRIVLLILAFLALPLNGLGALGLEPVSILSLCWHIFVIATLLTAENAREFA